MALVYDSQDQVTINLDIMKIFRHCATVIVYIDNRYGYLGGLLLRAQGGELHLVLALHPAR